MFKRLVKKIIFLVAICFSAISLKAHNFAVLSGLKGTYQELPVEFRKYSPIHGTLLVHSGELNKIYESGSPLGDIAQLLFYMHDGVLKPTARPSNPFFMIPAEFIAQIILALDSEKIFNEFLEDKEKFKKRFKGVYVTGGIRSNKQFNQTINSFFRHLEKLQLNGDLSGRTKLRKLFLSFAYLRAKTNKDLKTFLLLLLPEEFKVDESLRLENVFTKEDIEGLAENFSSLDHPEDEIEKIIKFLVLNQSSRLAVLIPKNRNSRYKEESFPSCVEDVLQAVMNFIFFNKQTQKFDIQRVAGKVNLNQKYKDFIAKYGDPYMNNYMEITKNDWVELLSGIPSLIYIIDDEYEMDSDKNNFLKAFSFLVGQEIKNFTQLGDLLSTEERTIKFTDQTINGHGIVLLEVIDLDGFVVSLEIDIDDGHADCVLKDENKEIVPLDFFKEIKKLNDVFNLPLSALVNVNETFVDAQDNTLLIYAVKKNDIEMVAFLLTLGADINKSNMVGGTPFSKASQDGNFEMIDLLRRSGANINSENIIGETPFQTAIRSGNIKVAEYLIKHGVPIDQKSFCKEKLFILALSNKKYKLASFLLEQKINPNYIDRYRKKSLFIDAVYSNNYQIVEQLIAMGADVNKTGEEDLFSGLLTAIGKQNVKIVNLLLNSGAEKYIDKADTLNLITPLLEAVIRGNYLMSEILLLYGANPNYENSKGKTPLLDAIEQKNVSLVALLLHHGASINYRTLKENIHPLEAAFLAEDIATVKELLSYKVIFDESLVKFIEDNKREILEKYGFYLRDSKSPNLSQRVLEAY
jgi:ankyrin repeat protein